jgi:hypothetical protein
MNRTFALCISIALVAGLGALTGCGDTKSKSKSTASANKDKKTPADNHDHDHAHHGPHDGELIRLGSEYQAEFVHDEATHKMTFYILDGDAKKSVPISASEVVVNYVADGEQQQAKFPAAPQAGEKEGQSSRFELVSKELCDVICEDPKSKARLNVTINDMPYSGRIEHHDHDHDHKK